MRQANTRHDNPIHDKIIQTKTRHDKIKQDKTRHHNTILDNARQDKPI